MLPEEVGRPLTLLFEAVVVEEVDEVDNNVGDARCEAEDCRVDDTEDSGCTDMMKKETKQ